jgi:hypothetical protein
MIGDSINLNLTSESQLATAVVDEWERGDHAKSNWKERVKEVTQYLFATDTRSTTNNTNGHEHSTHDPKLTQIYDTLRANYKLGLFSRARWFQFIGDTVEELFQEKRLVVEGYLRTKHRLSNFELELVKCLDDWIRTGNCFGEVFFAYETHEDEVLGTTKVTYMGPRLRRINPTDIVMNPLAVDADNAAKVKRSIHTLASLAKDVENPSMNYMQEAFDKAIEMRNMLSTMKTEDVDKATQLEFDGFGSFSEYVKSGYVEILDFYGDIFDLETNQLLKNHAVSVIDRRWVIRKEPLKTYRGKAHIFHAGFRQRPDNLWAMGPLDNLVGMQYMVNHLTNARADAFDLMLLPDSVIRGDVEIFNNEDGSTEYRVPESGDVRYLTPDTTVLQADLQIANMTRAMEEYAGAPKSAMGIKPPGEQTKFQVETLKTAGDNMFQQKLEEFERTFLEPILNAELEVAISGLSETDTIKVIDAETGVTLIQDIEPEDIYVEGNIQAVGASHFSRQSKLVRELSQFQTVLAQDPEVRDHFPSAEIGKLYEELLQFDEFDLFQENGRVSERAEKAKLEQIAMSKVQDTAAIDPTELIEGDLNEATQGSPIQPPPL